MKITITNRVEHACPQGGAEWHALRADKFTASEAPAMMGVSPYLTRAELLRQKKTGLAPEVDSATQGRFDAGHAAEVVSSRPAQAAAPAALPDYSQSAFADNLPKWSAAINGGRLTAEEVITRASTKGVLSEAQKAAIRAAAQPKPAPEPEPETEVIDAPEHKAQAGDDGWLQDYEATEDQQ